MALNLPPSSTEEQPVTTETFQKHYGRGSVGYADDHPHHRGHPPSQQSYSPTHYAPPGHQHPPPPLPPPYNACPPPPPAHGYHHPSSWYYPPHAAPAAVPPPLDDPASRRNASRASKHMHPSLVTPKSQDSKTLPPFVASSNGLTENKKRASGTIKRTATPKKKEGGKLPPSSNNDKEPEMGEEPKVEPMKQDFHFYAMDHYEEVKQVCQQQLDNAFADGTIVQTNTENQRYLLTTLLNARLIKNWEESSPSKRAEYLKKEEADRKRFMSEEEVASRHCATLTARRRSPKQSGDLGRAGSFGLSAVDVPSLGDGSGNMGVKRTKSEFDMNVVESSAKHAKAQL